MASKMHYFEGKIKWAFNLFVPDEYEDNKNWKCNFYPKDDAELQKVLATGVKLKVREDKEGETYVVFKRPTEKLFKSGPVSFDPPFILNDKGEPFDSEEEGGRIGNGTEIVAKIQVYDAGKRKGHRLEGVKVTRLNAYNSPESSGEKPNYKAKTEDLDDQVPF